MRALLQQKLAHIWTHITSRLKTSNHQHHQHDQVFHHFLRYKTQFSRITFYRLLVNATENLGYLYEHGQQGFRGHGGPPYPAPSPSPSPRPATPLSIPAAPVSPSSGGGGVTQLASNGGVAVGPGQLEGLQPSVVPHTPQVQPCIHTHLYTWSTPSVILTCAVHRQSFDASLFAKSSTCKTATHLSKQLMLGHELSGPLCAGGALTKLPNVCRKADQHQQSATLD